MSEGSYGSTFPSVYPRRMAASIIAIGNPGAGKSTILNSLAGELKFKSGVSLGEGLTYELVEEENEKGTFYDTPGLSDDTLREAAAKAISTALRKGGPFKILFFVRLEAGRFVREDVTTFKLVLESAPEIGNKYGIISNKVPINLAKILEDPTKAQVLHTKLFASIPEGSRCAGTSITYLTYNPDADSVDDYLLDVNSLTTLEGSHFQDFVYGEVETVELTVGKAKDIPIEDFDKTSKLIEVLLKKMESDREMFMEQQKLMREQLERAENDKKEHHARTNEMLNLQMELMKMKLMPEPLQIIESDKKEVLLKKMDINREAFLEQQQLLRDHMQRAEIDEKELHEKNKEMDKIEARKDKKEQKDFNMFMFDRESRRSRKEIKNTEKKIADPYKVEREKLEAKIVKVKNGIKEEEKQQLEIKEEEKQQLEIMTGKIEKKEKNSKQQEKLQPEQIKKQQRYPYPMENLGEDIKQKKEAEIGVRMIDVKHNKELGEQKIKDELEYEKMRNQKTLAELAASRRKSMRNRRGLDWNLVDLFHTDFGLAQMKFETNSKK